mmetsp:Transcript_20989/g.53140  ORF Transcript_20989/g.53140 Transcript_20989/m.53140 type:complete len:312 (-) Transcript_20989:2100-3035(-)
MCRSVHDLYFQNNCGCWCWCWCGCGCEVSHGDSTEATCHLKVGKAMHTPRARLRGAAEDGRHSAREVGARAGRHTSREAKVKVRGLPARVSRLDERHERVRRTRDVGGIRHKSVHARGSHAHHAFCPLMGGHMHDVDVATLGAGRAWRHGLSMRQRDGAEALAQQALQQGGVVGYPTVVRQHDRCASAGHCSYKIAELFQRLGGKRLRDEEAQLDGAPRHIRTGRAGPPVLGRGKVIHTFLYALVDAAIQLHACPSKRGRRFCPYSRLSQFLLHVLVVCFFAAVLQQQSRANTGVQQVREHDAHVQRLIAR